MNINDKNALCQVKSKEKYKFHYELLHDGLKDVEKFLESRPAAYKQVLKVLLTHPHDIMLDSMAKIAQKAGVERTSVLRVINNMVSDGVIAKISRHRKTSVIRLSNYFFKRSVRKKVLRFFNRKQFVTRKQYSYGKPFIRTIVTVSLLFSLLSRSCPPVITSPIKVKNTLLRNNQHFLGKSSVKVRKFYKKRSLRDSMEIKDELLQEIAQIKEIELTRLGVIELLKFDVKAIAYARNQLRFVPKDVRDKFRWLCKICLTISEKNNLPLNEELYLFALKAANFPSGTTKTHEETPKKSKAMYVPYEEPPVKALDIQQELTLFLEYLNTDAAKNAKRLGILFVPPHLRDHLPIEATTVPG